MVNSATGLMAAGDVATALRALIYLAAASATTAASRKTLDRRRALLERHPTRRGRLSDHARAAAWRGGNALGTFDPYPMVPAGARVPDAARAGDAQERWEENSGYSPSTLANNIAGVIARPLASP